ncbi:MAG: SDR family oxidoreductase [Pseudomonadota bacterium]
MKPQATIVTGGSNGIGAQAVQARAAAGDQVINLDRDQPPAGAPGETVRVDLSDSVGLRETLAQITGDLAITRVVNNAGVALLDSLESFEPDDFHRTLDINVIAPALIVQQALPAMKAAGWGRVVNIASRAALGKTLRTAYAGSKGALISATRVWALELARYGVTVNAIGPGPIATELFQRANPPDAPATKQILETIPVGRMGEPDDIAHAIDFFLDRRAGFVTGQVLYVCGGMTIGVAPT